jgi:hypothetical protein
MDVEKEIAVFKERNRRVEVDKAWETSWTRRLIIIGGTYGIAAWWLMSIGNNEPFLNAAVPAGGYLLSTLTLPIFKKWWVRQSREE